MPITTQDVELYTVQQAAKFLGVNPDTIRRWAQHRKIVGRKVGTRGDWRFKKEDLSKLVQTNQDNHIKSDKQTAFPIVGIGASAGGLEAASQFLQALPTDTGMGFVLIQHLDPSHDSILAELLSKKTILPVKEVQDDTKVIPNHVYVIPHNCDMIIRKGVLELIPRGKSKNIHMPIDQFFISLAESHNKDAIGIILSGTASDGTLGIKAIKSRGGMTFAQDETAKYQGMPKSAIASGNVDFVRSPAGMVEELTKKRSQPSESLLKDPENSSPTRLMEQEMHGENDGLSKIFSILRRSQGIDFTHYKSATIKRRIKRRMLLQRLKTYEEYTTYLKENSTEIESLNRDLLINVTSFFREIGTVQFLSDRIFSELVKKKTPKDPIRVWMPGCATGEEAYSIAIALAEYLADNSIHIPLQIFGTDVSSTVIEKARKGIYTEKEVANVSPERLERFFEKRDKGYQIVKSIRDSCIFATHNVFSDPPFSRLDLVSCCNLMIYLDGSLQDKILRSFHYALKAGGFLMLGKSESAGASPDLFTQIDRKHKIYARKNTTARGVIKFASIIPKLERQDASESHVTREEIAPLFDIQKEADTILLSHYTPASVVVNGDLEIIQFRGSTGSYLEPSPGKASFNLIKMAREGLGFELRSIVSKVRKSGKSCRKEAISIKQNGTIKIVTIEVMPLKAPLGESYFLVLFEDTAIHRATAAKRKVNGSKHGSKEHRIEALEKELAETREDMRSVTEEQEATNEELQTASEEILSSNEELQSINEELETSKEELESTNEELTTVNEELQNSNGQLTQARDYAETIIDTVQVPLLVLSRDLRVETVNRSFRQVFQVTGEETTGNLIYDLGNGQWDIPALRKLLHEILPQNNVFDNYEIEHTFPTIGHKIMLLNARKFYKEGDSILLAIEDITERKNAEEALRKSEEQYRTLFESIDDGFCVIEKVESKAGEPLDFRYVEVNPAFAVQSGVSNVVGKTIRQVVPGESEEWFETYDTVLRIGKPIRFEHGLVTQGRVLELYAFRVEDETPSRRVAVIFKDITERKQLELQKDEFIGIASHELKTPITTMKGYAQILEKNFQQKGDSKSMYLIQNVNKQADRLASLINDLLNTSTIQAGKLTLEKIKFDLNAMVSKTVVDFQYAISTHQIIKKGEIKGMVNADQSRIEQVLANLITNAIKYSPNADKVIVSIGNDERNVTVTIQDFGFGIAKSDQLKIFERFYRTDYKEEKNVSGFGLGLYISAEIIKSHKGKIWVESTKGNGATFSFTIPRE